MVLIHVRGAQSGQGSNAVAKGTAGFRTNKCSEFSMAGGPHIRLLLFSFFFFFPSPLKFLR